MSKNKTTEDLVESQINKCSKQIGYIVNEFTIGHLADEMDKLLHPERHNEESMFSIPDYQRDFVWADTPGRISRFIESVIMGLPIPFIFFFEHPATGKLEIIDGLQRMQSLHVFIHENYKLSRLQQLTNLNGKHFSDLSDSRQRKVRNKTIRGIALDERADARAREDLFGRINTGSLHAEPVEVRRGSLPGDFMQLIIELAEDTDFIALTPFKIKRVKRREREELVTRFFAYGDGLEHYNGLPAEFLFDYVKRMNKELENNSNKKEEYRQRFKQTMQFIKDVFPIGFRKTNTARTITRVRFESIAVGTWWAIRDKNGDASQLKRDDIETWLVNPDYQKLLRADGGNVPTKLKSRIEFVRTHLIGE